MSINQYQKQVNTLDKEIADLENKKSIEDKKTADYESKASKVTISKNASNSNIRMKKRQIQQHTDKANKAKIKSAEYAKKIGEKRKRRNTAYLNLQKSQETDNKKKEKESNAMRLAYEKRIAELEVKSKKAMPNSFVDKAVDLEKYDVFISHAWEDKEDFVNEFVEELKALGIEVWYDDTNTRWGSSLREEIDNGLKVSRYGIVVLSPNYIDERKYWTKKELNGLFQMESINSGTILPIWHNLTKKEVVEYSPIIADKKAMTTAILTPKEMAAEFSSLIKS